MQTQSNGRHENRAVSLRRWLLVGLIAIWAIVGLGIATTAQAEVRTLTATDPADAAPTITGKPDNPDLSSVTLTYDNTTGAIKIVQDFYNAFPSLDTTSNYVFFTAFSLRQGSGAWNVNGAVEEEGCGNDGLYGTVTDYSAPGTKYRNSFSITGVSGDAPFTTTVENGGTQVTSTGTSPAIIGRDWRCARVTLKANTHSTESNLESFYDEGCGCWAITTTLDYVGPAAPDGDIGPLWFPGFPTTRESAEAKKAREKQEAETRKKEAEAAELKRREEKTAAEERRREMLLTAGEAKADLERELRRHYRRLFVKASQVSVDCSTKINRSRRRCSVFFEGGPSFRARRAGQPVQVFQHRYRFGGTGLVWLKREGNQVYWLYSLRLRRTDNRCTFVRSAKAACTKALAVK